MRTVLKFGGSSVADLARMKSIAEKLARRQIEGEELVVVVSAMGKTTNQLLSMAREASENPSKREVDMMLATGEQISIALLTMILQEKGVKAVSLTGYQAGILTEGIHTKNKIRDIDPKNIEKYLSEGYIVVVAGFQGFNESGEITTLGRGGSDTTAVALAAKLHCHCEIYTDVDGIYGVDPRLYPRARHMDSITYEEMKEMAFLGAKVMEPRSVDIAQNYGVIIYVGSAHEDKRGTYIQEGEKNVEERSITGLSVLENIMMVTISHLPERSIHTADIFTKLAEEEINVDMISQTPMPDGSVTLSFTASAEDRKLMESVLHEVVDELPGAELTTTTEILKVSVVGSGMRTQSGVAARIFTLFAQNGITFKQVSTSEISISYTMEKKHKEKAVELIADAFSL
ncbi:aspartate kinase [Proteiniclasticum sp. C24MP]|uniref:aspartate kinase n=1 Tax=Proteiniclasticum sp. C24MP TaxID=3374101 RepID=UPI003753E8B4